MPAYLPSQAPVQTRSLESLNYGQPMPQSPVAPTLQLIRPFTRPIKFSSCARLCCVCDGKIPAQHVFWQDVAVVMFVLLFGHNIQVYTIVQTPGTPTKAILV